MISSGDKKSGVKPRFFIAPVPGLQLTYMKISLVIFVNQLWAYATSRARISGLASVGVKPPDTLVIFGRHLHPGANNYIMAEGIWSTPLGDLEIDNELAERLVEEFSFTIETTTRFDQDNTIELQLPFIKYFFNDVKIVAMGVPPAKSSLEIGRAVVEIAKGLQMRINVIGSTDLTHYGRNYGFTSAGTGARAVDWVRNENDRRIIDTMLDMDTEAVINEALSRQNACCAGAAATAIEAAKRLGADQAESIAYASSFDKSPGDSFVGYTGIVF